ncbi:hypothetical protein GCM10025868_38490 [Angustibacter aerolatus]|uniref:Homoserine dehydrogenase catalytic domain-containing protein n=1 Tax=Angustibacter aerolatus TaxID=1162965 RepID=A0ABQ6JMP6_9ACTN|nr:hypothetical protein GCM10025868_38490 [Angustibacter aerolatus]
MPASAVYREGISEVTAADIAAAREMDAVVKLLAICERVVDDDGTEGVSVRVHPAMIPRRHPLGGVREAFNAVFVEAQSAGGLMFYGRGAGGEPTASAVLGDVVAVARHRVLGGRGPGSPPTPTCRCCRWAAPAPGTTSASTWPTGRACSRRSRRCSHGTRCRSRRSGSRLVPGPDGERSRAALVVVTHQASDAALSATVEALADLDVVEAVASVMRVEGE